MKSLPIALAYERTHGSRISNPDISHQSEFLPGTYAGQWSICRNISTEGDSCPNLYFTTSVTVSFNGAGFMISAASFYPDEQSSRVWI
ncbi:hypothetical protein TNCV_2716621 [Trichonephila clavipes]|nr:hypothetical protein TNCV_2716621 [Trichonephila clavipes]